MNTYDFKGMIGVMVEFELEEPDDLRTSGDGKFITINPNETPEELKERVQKIEHYIYPLAAKWVASEKAIFKNGECWIDG